MALVERCLNNHQKPDLIPPLKWTVGTFSGNEDINKSHEWSHFPLVWGLSLSFPECQVQMNNASSFLWRPRPLALATSKRAKTPMQNPSSLDTNSFSTLHLDKSCQFVYPSESIFALPVCRWQTDSETQIETEREGDGSIATAAKPDLAVRALPGSLVWSCLFSVLPLFWADWHLHSNSQRMASLAALDAAWNGVGACSALQIEIGLRSEDVQVKVFAFGLHSECHKWMPVSKRKGLSKESTCRHIFWCCSESKLMHKAELLYRGGDSGEGVLWCGESRGWKLEGWGVSCVLKGLWFNLLSPQLPCYCKPALNGPN